MTPPPGEHLDAATSREPRSSVRRRRILKGELLHLYSFSIVCCWWLWTSNFQLIRFCSESAAPLQWALCVWGSVRNAMGMSWPWWNATDWYHWKRPTKSYGGIWGQSLTLWTQEIQHHCCSWFVLLTLQGPSIMSTWQQLQVVKQGWACNIPTLTGNGNATYWKGGMGTQNGGNSNVYHGCTLESFHIIPSPFECLLK